MGILRDAADEEGPIWIGVGRLDVGVCCDWIGNRA